MTPSRTHSRAGRAVSFETSALCARVCVPAQTTNVKTNSSAMIPSAGILARKRAKDAKAVPASRSGGQGWPRSDAAVLILITFRLVIDQSGARYWLNRLLHQNRFNFVTAYYLAPRCIADVLNSHNEQRGNQHEHTAGHHHVHRGVVIIGAKKRANDRPKRERLGNLGNDDEEIEDAHVNADARRRQRAG